MKNITVKGISIALSICVIAGAVTLAACKGEKNDPQNTETTAAEEVTGAEELTEDTGSTDAEAAELEERQIEMNKKLEALCEAGRAVPKGTGTPLTDDELDSIMKSIPSITTKTYKDYSEAESDYEIYSRDPASRFLSSYYSDIKDIDLHYFLRYAVKYQDENIDGAEYNEVIEAIFGEGADANTLPGLQKIKASGIRELFKKYSDISLEELNSIINDDSYYYEKYDNFYTYTTDAEFSWFSVADGERIGDEIYLYSQTGNEILVLKEADDGGYKFVSLLPCGDELPERIARWPEY